MSCASSQFTGKERDSESGLDYFGARYCGSTMGRWMSPDWADKPEGVPYASLGDPQSLNLYGYVWNNPLSRFDSDGHEAGMCYGCGPGGQDLSPLDPRYPEPKMSATEKQVDLAILDVAATAAGVGALPELIEGGHVITAAITGLSVSGTFVSATTRLAGAVTGKSKETAPAADAVATITNPAGLAVTAATGNLKAGSVAADASDAANAAAHPAEAVKNAAATASTVLNVVQDVKDTITTVSNWFNPAPPAPPAPPHPPGQCRGDIKDACY